MNRLLYRLMLAIAEHLDKVNTADAASVDNDWRSGLNDWDSYRYPYPAARRAIDS